MRLKLLILTCLWFVFAIGLTSCSNSKINICANNSVPIDPKLAFEVTRADLPHHYVCHLFVERKRGIFPSTGFFVSERCILTAGHSAGEWRKIFKNKIVSVKVVVFEHFTTQNEYKFLGSKTFSRRELKFGTHPKYSGAGSKSRPYDFGFFKLPDDSLFKDSKLTGFYKIEKAGNITDTTPVHLSGYSGDKQLIKEGSLWIRNTTIADVKTTNNNFISYSMFTSEGDSGAPVWISYGNDFVVIGIHNTGFTTCNGGTAINDETRVVIEKWIKE